MEIAIAVAVVAVAAAVVANVRTAMSDGYRKVPTCTNR
jgi:ribosomal protein L3